MNTQNNIFITGLDAYNAEVLKQLEDQGPYRFVALSHGSEVMIKTKGKHLDFENLIERAKLQLNKFDGTINGIISCMDPAMMLTYYLCEQYGMKGPGLANALRCEHKYWSRLEQKKVIPEHIPDFMPLNPFEDHRLEDLRLKPPFWLKPVKSYSSQLGFNIENQQDLDAGLAQMRENIGQFSRSFNYMLSQIDRSILPDEVKQVDGNFCVAEGLITGRQYTVEGYTYEGQVHIHGFFDSLLYDGVPSFFAYVTPSDLPEAIQQRTREIITKVVSHMQLNNATFNIEFRYDEAKNHIWLLEINTRISQSHSEMFKKVHGFTNHLFMVEVAIGNKPSVKMNQGRYNIAAKLHPRVFTNEGRVVQLPSEDKIKQIEKEFDATIYMEVEEGQELADLPGQDSFSSLLASIHLGADNKQELLDKYEEVLSRLDIKVETYKTTTSRDVEQKELIKPALS